jgi:hypothetical protein
MDQIDRSIVVIYHADPLHDSLSLSISLSLYWTVVHAIMARVGLDWAISRSLPLCPHTHRQTDRQTDRQKKTMECARESGPGQQQRGDDATVDDGAFIHVCSSCISLLCDGWLQEYTCTCELELVRSQRRTWNSFLGIPGHLSFVKGEQWKIFPCTAQQTETVGLAWPPSAHSHFTSDQSIVLFDHYTYMHVHITSSAGNPVAKMIHHQLCGLPSYLAEAYASVLNPNAGTQLILTS